MNAVLPSKPPRTLDDLADFVRASSDLNDTSRRDHLSAISTFVQWVGLPGNILIADGRHLAPYIKRLHHAQLGISLKRFQNVISCVRVAIKLAGATAPGARHRGYAHLDHEWSVLRKRLPAHKYLVPKLTRALRFFSDHGIEPTKVDDASFFRFYEQDLCPHSLTKNPFVLYRRAVGAWNVAVELVDGWPNRELTLPSKRKRPFIIPLDQFPQSLRDELEKYASSLRSPNLLADDDRRPLAEATISGRLYYLRIAASALVRLGFPIESLATLHEIVARPKAKAVLEKLYEGRDRTKGVALHLIAITLTQAAKLLGEPEEDVKALKLYVKRLRPPSSGMTRKNQERLKPFDDIDNVRLFLQAPSLLVKAAEKRGFESLSSQIDLAVAAAVSILQFAPARPKNLSQINLKGHLRFPTSTSNREGHLHFDKHETKNRREIDLLLPPCTMQIIDFYLKRRLKVGHSDLLFPRATTPRKQAYFGLLIAQRVKRVTGLDVNFHLFRHIAAKLFLDRNPGQYEVVRVLLGHASVRTTVNFYCGMEKTTAIRHFDLEILRLSDDVGIPSLSDLRKRTKRTNHD